MKKSRYEIDVKDVISKFPKLVPCWSDEKGMWALKGEIDIFDSKGDYWESFNIEMYVPKEYPHCVPEVIEVGNQIERIPDRHVSLNGKCCLDIEHKLLIHAKRGVNLLNFFNDKVYTFFANQAFFKEKGKFAGAEYKHGDEGIRQFYDENLNLKDSLIAAAFISRILSNHIPDRNELCPCGSTRKTKKCHQDAIDKLRMIDKSRLVKDLQLFHDFDA